MRIQDFVNALGEDFFTGVPDSQLKQLCDYLVNTYGIDAKHHVIAANEGNCAALASGYHLATGKVPVVYMQNSGEGNIINPLASLMNDKVYGIPCIFIIGWRGEPGLHDEPQHIYQGEVTIKLLDQMDVASFIVGKDTAPQDIADKVKEWQPLLAGGKQVAFVIKKGVFEYDSKAEYGNSYTLNREEALKHIAAVTGADPVVSTTGKISRELFEIRESNGQPHEYDFLTVGSMGHCSSIALGVAVNKPDARIWCIDGDGAVIMHMGSMGVIGSVKPKNMIHVVLNNEAHDTVGGMPTVSGSMDLVAIAKACGYPRAMCVDSLDALDTELEKARDAGELSFIEVRCATGARKDLGRPTTTAMENKDNFMNYLNRL